MEKNQFPKGWDEARVQSVLKYHEKQSEAEAVEEIEKMFGRRDSAIMTVPRPLVPQVRKLIAEHARKHRGKVRKEKRAA